MSSHTRYARPVSQPGAPQSSLGTMVFGAPRHPAQEDWTRVHRLVRSACREEPRPGAFLFAVPVGGGPLGRLWLSATETPRAGTLGRHEAVDLPYALDPAVSLRHVLFVVRLAAGRVRFTVLDLETSNGLHTSAGQQQQLEADRPSVLRAAGLSFFCVPTGPEAAINTASDDASRSWALFAEPPPRRAPSFVDRFLAGHTGPSGVLDVQLGHQRLSLPLDDAQLERGVLLGREPRCHVVLPHPHVSRVHAVVLGVDGAPYLCDTGSSNGTWRGPGERVGCARLGVEGEAFQLGGAVVAWRALH